MSAAQQFLIAFLALFAFRFVLERWLAVLNARYIRAHSAQVPDALAGAIPPETFQRSVEYALARTRFGHVNAAISAILTLFFLLSGFLPWLDRRIVGFGLGSLSYGVALLAAFTIINSILDLPLDLYATFVLEARFGFNQTTVRTYVADKIKGALLGAVIGVPFLYGLLAFVTRGGPLWWLWGALFVIGVQLVLMILYPIVIAPLFNKFTPLADGELKSELETLARRCDFSTRGIFVMDGSKRSAHSNAYFTGLGRARRIVLYDTIIQQMSVPELTAVLAHEIGHYKKKHVYKMLALSCALTVAGFYVLSLLLDWPPLYEAFGISAANKPMGLLLSGLIAGAFTFWVAPLFNALLRKHEYEADRYAVAQASAPPLESALLKLFEKNLSTLTPHPAFSAWYYSHPTLLERIGALRGAGRN